MRNNRQYMTVDLFAGPGGLAEGFSSMRNADGGRAFPVALSVEKEISAFTTLRLRSFVRQFDRIPEAYYEYVAGLVPRAELIRRYPAEWAAAVEETMNLELGTPQAQEAIDPRLDRLRDATGGDTLLIGGPPCQAYSLVGRARNSGTQGYVASADHRHFLYKEYVRILDRLQPIAFVMENVKGMLSSKVGGTAIFDRVLSDLRNVGGVDDSYVLLPLVAPDGSEHSGRIIRSERFGIPQARHRVILLGVRRDVLAGRPPSWTPACLEPAARQATVAAVLRGMPPLRSGVSRSADGPAEWRQAMQQAYSRAIDACGSGPDQRKLAEKLRSYRQQLDAQGELPPRASSSPAPIADNFLGAWLCDGRLPVLPNHQSRGHMVEDLARYVFAATFAEETGRSPKASEFPAGLAPEHRNWESGKFADRFRVQVWDSPATTVTSHISKDGHYYIHPDPAQCRSLTVREAARLQTFPDNYFFEGNRTQQYVQVGNAVPPLLAYQIAEVVLKVIEGT